MTCVACILEKKNINSSKKPAHTCARADKAYKEPPSCLIADEKHYKVIVYDRKVTTNDAALFRLQHQYLNGCKVKRFTEMWVNHRDYSGPSFNEGEACIWLHERKYNKLVFS